MVNISISDNGIGIGYLKERDQHFGIGIMHERASKLAGYVVFSSNTKPPVGSQTEAAIPQTPINQTQSGTLTTTTNSEPNLPQGTKVTLIFPSQQEPANG